MTRRRTIFTLAVASIFLSVIGGTASAQSRPVSNAQAGRTYREKTFLHSDRSTYLTGESVWFSVFCTDATTNKPSGLSKLAYVELTGPDKNATVHAKIVLSNGNGNGYLLLPSSLPSGTYSLRGWTQWMRNFAEEGCFTATLRIINPAKRPEPVNTIMVASLLAGFYPEGGHLVEGLEGLVACHVTDLLGKGVPVAGVLMRDDKDSLVRFTTNARGFGSFHFKPEPGAAYSVALLTTDGRIGTYPLPATDKGGYAFSVSHDGSKGRIVQATPGSGTAHETLTLVLMKGKNVLRAWEGRNLGEPVSWTLPDESIPDGMSRLLLFSQAGEPLAERSLFKKPTNALLAVRASTGQGLFGKRKPVDLQMESLTPANAPTPTTLSVSIFKLDSLEIGQPERIADWLWLGSNLRGLVEDPSYYLSDSVTAEASDLLMLTQGWSRFKWSDTATPVLRFAPEYSGHLITGMVTRRSDGSPLKGIPAYLSVQGKRFHLGSALSDEAGRVAFDLKKIYGNGSIILQTGVDSTAHVQLDDPWKNEFPKPSELPLKLDPSLAGTLRQAVLYNRAGQKPPTAEHFYFPDATDSLPFFGQPEKTYLLDDYTRFRTMDEVFREFISEVQVKRPRGNYELRVDHAPLPEFFTTDPLMLLDGVPYFNTNEVMNFDPAKIRKIDIVNRHFYQGSQDYSGIISMITYDGDGGGIPLNPNAVLVEYEGLQLRREFPATEYRTPEQLSSHQPDFRRLLHWAPSIWTGEKGRADLRFYTGDDKGKYLIVVQGLSDEGLAGTSISTIEVK